MRADFRKLILAFSLIAIPIAIFEGKTAFSNQDIAPSNDSGPATKFDISLPLEDMVPNIKNLTSPPLQEAPTRADLPSQNNVVGSALSTIQNFEGIGEGFTGPSGAFQVSQITPDVNGAVGPDHYVQLVNSSFAVFTKLGVPILGPIPTNTLWKGFGGGCEINNDGNGIVKYDRLADRWVITQFSVSKRPFLECIAVSRTGDPRGAYARYSFKYRYYPDKPTLGVWPGIYFITFDMFNGPNLVGPQVCGYNRGAMLRGEPATQQCEQLGPSAGSLQPSNLEGKIPPPPGSPNYLLSELPGGGFGMWRYYVDFETPKNTKLTGPISFPNFVRPPNNGGKAFVPQPSSSNLDIVGGRLLYPLAYRNFGEHESLVFNHVAIARASTRPGSGFFHRTFWYELRNLGTTPIIFQEGLIGENNDAVNPTAPIPFAGSIAMNRARGIALGYSISGSTINPSIHFSGRTSNDPIGSMPLEGVIINGTGSQEAILGDYLNPTVNPWTSYSSMVVDPSDDCTFWYTNEYLKTNGNFNWHTRIASFKLPGC